MIWLLTRISAWLNRPYDIGPELDRLRRKHGDKNDVDSDDDADA